MGKNKLQRFEELKTLERVFQPEGLWLDRSYHLKGKWVNSVFRNTNPLVIELGCGRGEYTVSMAGMFPKKNFIGIDKKGARLWRGVKTINELNIQNAAFLRIQILQLTAFFGKEEVSEIWITFPDPQPGKGRENLRMTSARFLEMYREILEPGGEVHLKTDNRELYDYTMKVLNESGYKVIKSTNDLYADQTGDPVLQIETGYEKRFREQGLKIHYLRFSFQ